MALRCVPDLKRTSEKGDDEELDCDREIENYVRNAAIQYFIKNIILLKRLMCIDEVISFI